MHGCIVSTVPTDALVLKHQAISIHSAGKIFVVVVKFHTEYDSYMEQYWKLIKLHLKKKNIWLCEG